MNVESNPEQRCVLCDRSSREVPLIPFEFRDARYAICPQHLPVLIHDPKALGGRLPGAEDLSPSGR